MTFIDAKDLNYYYQDGENRRYILKDVDCQFEKGKFYTILGQSGSGKTTFLSLISALDAPKSGVIAYEGTDIKTIGYEKYRRNNVGIIFQSYNLVPYMTAVENVLVAMSITENKLPADQKEVAYNLLDYIGITKSKADRRVNKLSGGEQQRVAIARALATNVELILADEPTGNLDEEMENEIVDIFKRLAHEHNKCVIVVTHSNEIAQKSDEIIYLRKGKMEKNSAVTNEA
ncbi:MAG: ABC transporter ATP-binding protein [Culicoidibacterales bacterium]